MYRFVRVVSLVFSIVLMLSASGYAAGSANLILIFDASGSMWGQIDGTAKISIAKETLDLIVNDLPEDINVGLGAY
jgi:Ca-activated chloride channel family protein